MVRWALCGLFVIAVIAGGCEGPLCDVPGGLCGVEEATRTHFGFAPDSLVRVDVDGDGVEDLAGASHVRGTVTVVWGAGQTLGGTATTLSVGPEVAGLAALDVDADGVMDLATAVPRDDEVAVLRGIGGRGFEVRRIVVGAGPRDVISAQLDGHGAAELVTVNGDGTVSVVREGVVKTTVVVGPEPRGVAAGDFNNDGSVDIVVAVTGRGALQVLMGDGAGGLVPGETFAVGLAPKEVVAADFDGDGAVDVAALDGLEDSLGVVFGDGKGGVKGRRAWPTVARPVGLVVVPGAEGMVAVVSQSRGTVQTIDANTGEGLRGPSGTSTSALVASEAGELMYVGSGRIGTMVAAPGVQLEELWVAEDVYTSMVIVIDVDGDGVDELVVPSYPGSEDVGEFTVLRGGVEDSRISSGGLSVGAIEAGDFDGDGVRELVGVGTLGGVVMQSFGGDWRLSQEFVLPGGATAVAVADLDGDGKSELIVGELRVVEVFGLDDEGVMQSKAVLSTGMMEDLDSVWEVWPVDGDGDGQLDLLWRTGDGLVYREDGLVAERTALPLDLGGIDTVSAIELFDVDDDGTIDAVMCTESGLAVVHDVLGETPGAPVRVDLARCFGLMRGDVDGDGRRELVTRSVNTVTPWWVSEGQWTRGAGWMVEEGFVVQYAQLDGDGVSDVLTHDEQTVHAWRTTSGAGLMDEMVRQFGGAGPAFGDFDGDGVLDAFWYSSGLAVAFGDGDGGFGPMRHAELPAGLDAVYSAAVADFDGDGVDEVVIAARREEAWGTELLQVVVTEHGMFEARSFGWVERVALRVAVGDLDEDGMSDLVAYAEGDVMLLSNTGSGEFAAPRVVGHTEAIGSARVMDIDADGHLDFVWFQFGGYYANVVFVQRGLGGGELGSEQVWWYGGGIVLTFADLTGDGLLDLLTVVAETGDVLLVPGNGAKAGRGTRRLLRNIDAVTAADIDGDGRAEVLAVREHEVEGYVTLLVGRWGADGPSFVVHAVEADARTIVVRDFDGDGDVEVALIGEFDVTILREVL